MYFRSECKRYHKAYRYGIDGRVREKAARLYHAVRHGEHKIYNRIIQAMAPEPVVITKDHGVDKWATVFKCPNCNHSGIINCNHISIMDDSEYCPGCGVKIIWKGGE